jgi:signal peptidase II
MTTDERDTTPSEVTERPRRIALFVAVALFVLAADQISKAVVVRHLSLDRYQSVRLLGGLFHLNQTRNSGAAFSFGTGFTIVLTVVALVVVVVIARFAGRLRSIGWAIALGLILGGALGNLGDRFFREPGVGRGHVVDWISLFGPYDTHFAIFNLADSGITIGAITAGVLAVVGIDFAGRRNRD